MCNVAMFKTMIQIGMIYCAISNSMSHTSQSETTAGAFTRETTVRSASNKKREVIDMKEKIREAVKSLCPMADICAENVTNADLQPNGKDRFRRASCCKACSCHPDCKERKNCCFPDDLEGMKDASAVHECIYTRIGREAVIDGNVPAYSTVMAAPEQGCVDNSPVRVTANITLTPTCDDIDITPLGFYFPVYSEDTGEIYKNILCARCHGVTKTTPFSAALACKNPDRGSKSHLPLSKYLSFLESKVLGGLCRVDFRFADSLSLTNKRCYNKVIHTCNSTVSNITVELDKDVISFDADVIKEMCESDFYSPTVRSSTGLVYKNVFCALCGNNILLIRSLLCLDDEDNRADPISFSVFLNPQIMHIVGIKNTQTRNPEVCLTQHKSESQKKCRITYCPTGKIRNANGHCVLVGDIFNTGGIFVRIKLTPQEPDFDEKDEKADDAQLMQIILETNPWPKDWTLQTIFVRVDDTVCEEKGIIIVNMASPDKPTQAKYDDIEKTMRLPWHLSPTIHLSQSFLEYNFKTTKVFMGFVPLVPSWQTIQTDADNSHSYISCGPIEWKLIKKSLHLNQATINKLYVCDQIQLQTSEFVLGDRNVFLKSNLTIRTLYDLEFEIIEDIHGIQARVCLSDTIFTETKLNVGKSLQSSTVVVLTHAFIIQSVYLG